MPLHFSGEEQRSRFFRELRLVHDDLVSYAQAAAPYCAINSQAENRALVDSLNRNAMFWNCVLAALQSSAFICIAKLHDKSKDQNHLAHILRVLKKQSPECMLAALQVDQAITSQRPFIDKVLALRNQLFAHTHFEAPLIATFGFEGLTIQSFREYWSTVMGALVLCDEAMFGDTQRSPKFDASLFEQIERSTLLAIGIEHEK